MPSASYPYAVGRIRVIEQSLLGEDKLQRLSELKRSEFARTLTDWGFASDCPVKNDVDALVEWREKQMRATVEDVTPEPSLTDLFLFSADAADIKLLIKARELAQTDVDGYLQKGVYSLETLKRAVEAKDYSALGQPIGVLLDAADSAPFEPRRLSAAVDSAVYAEIFHRLKLMKNRFCTEYFMAEADCTNLLSMLRAKKLGYGADELAPMLVEGGNISPKLITEAYGSDDTVAVLRDGGAAGELIDACMADDAEIRVAEIKTALASRNAYDSFGIGPIVNFTVCALDECRRIRVAYVNAGRGQI